MGLEMGTKGQHISNKPKYVIHYPKPIPKRQLGLMLSAQRDKVISVILLSI